MNTLVGSARNIKYIKPTYITSTPKGCGDNQKSIIETNNDLAHSLWKLYKSKDKFWLENIYPAIVSFNKANTLSDNALDIGQTIQNLFSSIEKLLLGNKHGLRKILINLKENQPVELLKSALSSETYRLWKTDTYEYKEMKVDKKIELDSIFLIWIKELLNLRNDFAHGKINSSKSIHWNEGEHMFLATVLCQELITQTATKKPSKVLKNFEKLLAKKSIFEDEQGKSGYSDFILELMLESSE